MICPKCGKELPEGTKFCIYCGIKLELPTAPVKEEPVETGPKPDQQVASQQNHVSTAENDNNATVLSGIKKTILKITKYCLYVFGVLFVLIIIIGIANDKDDQSKDDSTSSSLSSATVSNMEEDAQNEMYENEEYDSASLLEAQMYEELYDCNYHGFIDGEYPITAHVLFTTLGAEGSYYYDKNGADQQLKLVGHYESYGSELWVVLKEYNKNEEQTGTFYVKKSTEDRSEISGTFVIASSGKEMPFELSTNGLPTAVSSSTNYVAGERVLTETELSGFSKEELRVLRNEIYARHGHIFKSADLSSYFSRFDWYHPDTDNAFNRLSDTEKKNIDIIKSMESSAPSRYLDLASEVVSIK